MPNVIMNMIKHTFAAKTYVDYSEQRTVCDVL